MFYLCHNDLDVIEVQSLLTRKVHHQITGLLAIQLKKLKFNVYTAIQKLNFSSNLNAWNARKCHSTF